MICRRLEAPELLYMHKLHSRVLEGKSLMPKCSMVLEYFLTFTPKMTQFCR